jgi:sulfur relay (sulfurtransferase) DsrF/TusC family protein
MFVFAPQNVLFFDFGCVGVIPNQRDKHIALTVLVNITLYSDYTIQYLVLKKLSLRKSIDPKSCFAVFIQIRIDSFKNKVYFYKELFV